MDNTDNYLDQIRAYVDSRLDTSGQRPDATLDDVLAGLRGNHLHHAREFADEYLTIASEYQSRIAALQRRKKNLAERPGVSLHHLAYHALVPGASLGLVTSSMTYAALGATAGFFADAVNQRRWMRTASPAAVGWWTLLGGTAGAVVDYAAQTSMPFFTYIMATGAGMLSALMQADKVIHRDTQKTITDELEELHVEFLQQRNAMMDQYATMMGRTP